MEPAVRLTQLLLRGVGQHLMGDSPVFPNLAEGVTLAVGYGDISLPYGQVWSEGCLWVGQHINLINRWPLSRANLVHEGQVFGLGYAPLCLNGLAELGHAAVEDALGHIPLPLATVQLSQGGVEVIDVNTLQIIVEGIVNGIREPTQELSLSLQGINLVRVVAQHLVHPADGTLFVLVNMVLAVLLGGGLTQKLVNKGLRHVRVHWLRVPPAGVVFQAHSLTSLGILCHHTGIVHRLREFCAALVLRREGIPCKPPSLPNGVTLFHVITLAIINGLARASDKDMDVGVPLPSHLLHTCGLPANKGLSPLPDAPRLCVTAQS